MREFNLEEAKAGKPVCTRDGRNARIICFDVKHEYYPIIALIESEGKEFSASFGKDGRYYADGSDCEADLFMKPEKHEGWGWITNHHSMFAFIYKTKKEALARKPIREQCFLAKVEWEE